MKYLVLALEGDRAVATTFRGEGRKLLFHGVRHYASTDGEFSAALGELAAAGPYRTVVLLLDPATVFARRLTLPLPDRRKLRDVLPLEMRGETAFDADHLAFEGIPLRGGEAFALWTKREPLAKLIADLKNAGLDPRVATPGWATWGELLVPTGAHALTDGRSLAVFNGGELAFSRYVGDDFAGETARSLAALELSTGIAIRTVYLIGGAHLLPAIPLRGEIDLVPLPVAGELDTAFTGAADAALEYAGHLAALLAASGKDPVNFRHGSLAFTADLEASRRALRTTAILFTILVLLLAGRLGLKYYSVHSDVASLDASITKIYREIFPGRKKGVDEAAEISSEIRRLGAGTGGVSPLGVMKKIAAAKTDDITSIFEIETDGNQVRVKGDARSADAFAAFRKALAPSFADLDAGETKSRPDGGVTFALRGTVAEEER